MSRARSLSLVSLLVLFTLAGCGGGDKSTKPVVPPSDGLPAGTPAADSPLNLAKRLEATWENRGEAEYGKLLSADFRYQFSLASDPLLVNMYPNWNRTDEIAALTHLFHGFTNEQGTTIPAASRIDMTPTGVQVGSDPDHPDSSAQYQRMVVTNLEIQVEVPSGYEPVTYNISARHEFYLVRGDAAVLPAGAVANTTRWYVRRWDDLSTSTTARKGPVINPAQPKTLGGLKSEFYR